MTESLFRSRDIVAFENVTLSFVFRSSLLRRRYFRRKNTTFLIYTFHLLKLADVSFIVSENPVSD